MQRANYGIGEEAVQRFSLTAEDKASLELAEWVAGAYRRALVCFSLPMAYSLIVHAH
jgi:zinc finger FYVE domain-containing protein 26